MSLIDKKEEEKEKEMANQEAVEKLRLSWRSASQRYYEKNYKNKNW